MPIPTSVALTQLLHGAPPDEISLGWIVTRLEKRSFGFLMLVLALVGLAPGIASFSGFVLAIPAIQMMLGRDTPALPRFLAARSVPTHYFARWVGRLVPAFRRIEGFVRPRWAFPQTKRIVGVVDLAMAITIVLPFPFAYIIPTLVIVLISFAWLEEDGVLLCTGFVAAALSLAFSIAQVWAALAATGALARLWLGA
jgi:hypothetical protein